ncbi:MAG: LptE family protein [Proteobacteria bacterium]|nr:LptE family protein [Pseudomonadota bacterium]
MIWAADERGGHCRCFEGLVVAVLAAVLVAGCTYSFKGGSVPPHLKTLAIPIIQDQSGYGDPRLRDQFTNTLIERFTNDNTMTLVDQAGADAILEAVITNVREDAVSVAPGEEVRQRRMTVVARATFRDIKLKKTLWEKSFSQYGDFPSGGGPSLRDAGVLEAIQKLTEDILNETVAGW